MQGKSWEIDLMTEIDLLRGNSVNITEEET